MDKENPPDKSRGIFKCVKIPLQHVLKDKDVNTQKIFNTVVTANKIVIHTLQFMKLYLLNYYHTHRTLPKIDKLFVNCCLKTVCVKKTARGRPPNKETQILKTHLTDFYNNHYKHFTHEELEYTCMTPILDYITIDIITMYENNIKQHYIEYVERYVNVMFNKKSLIDKIKKERSGENRDASIKSVTDELRKIKNDLLNNTRSSHPSYHQWIEQHRSYVVPTKEFKNNLYYDLQCSPQDYFPCMVYMMDRIEKRECTIYNLFPMRTEIIPKHIRIDTAILVNLLIIPTHGTKTEYLSKGNLKLKEDQIWNFFFQTDRKCFKKKHYSFHHMIETDGVSCSLLFLRNDMIGKRFKPTDSGHKDQYIDELRDYSQVVNKKIVAIDPGLSDLLYCVDGDTRDRNFFRYTQDQRRKETKGKKYTEIILEQKQTVIDGKTIIDWEREI